MICLLHRWFSGLSLLLLQVPCTGTWGPSWPWLSATSVSVSGCSNFRGGSCCLSVSFMCWFIYPPRCLRRRLRLLRAFQRISVLVVISLAVFEIRWLRHCFGLGFGRSKGLYACDLLFGLEIFCQDFSIGLTIVFGTLGMVCVPMWCVGLGATFSTVMAGSVADVVAALLPVPETRAASPRPFRRLRTWVLAGLFGLDPPLEQERISTWGKCRTSDGSARFLISLDLM
ncbi:hypothetical protein Hamer_G008854 [Homarus americanus]|uniref:Uncharacterized protein n=1 Tax=Homarus americanus TaxID=6706 RepID=A0A8J5JP87_HOMAM|nr:hypothetical protein Hamer_G008854 [Homarus americanus]